MTRSRLNAMIKQAKSAKDKAMETAAMLGKPTSTGIAAGAGLGAILAAAGALSRSGEDDENVSVLSNPLLLGSLGAAGGYLAGNAFEKTPTHRANKDISGLARLGLLGGAGTLGAILAKEDAKELLYGLRDESGKLIKNKGKAVSLGAKKVFDDIVKKHNLREAKLDNGIASFKIPANDSVRAEFNEAQKNYIDALKRSGRYSDAMREAGFTPSKSLFARMLDRAVNHPFSPVSWARSTKNLALRGSLGRILLGPGSVAKNGKKVISEMGNIFRRPGVKIPSRLAALALLAGGGKAIYDKVHD